MHRLVANINSAEWRCLVVKVETLAGVVSLRCFSCKEFNDGGCAADRIKIEVCTPPRNVCLEAITIVTIDQQNVSAAIKGCDIGVLHSQLYQKGLFNTSHRRLKAHACSEDLCNTLVTEDFMYQPPFILNDSSVPNDRECYSCISTSRDQCSTKNAAVVRCQGHSPVCYQGIGTIVLGHQNNISLPYFIKECAQSFSCEYSGTASEYENHTRRGSCCNRNLCNDLEPNGGPGAATYAAPLIVAALLAISGL
ncbi:ly6/PLAUR domain-containing protein 3-like isoform X2 [Lissotriton helveticus]